MGHLTQLPHWLDEISDFNWFDDFPYYVSGDFWTNLAADGGITAFAESDGHAGIITGATGATDNNEIGIFTSNEIFKWQAGKPFYIRCRFQFTEANTDDANVAFGTADAMGANLLSDNGGGDNINNTGALIFKVDGETVWRVASVVNGGTVTEHATNTPAGGASYQELVIEAAVIDGSIDEYEINYFVDGVQLRDTNDIRISHRQSYTTTTEMDIGSYIKAGDTNTETLNIDWMGISFKR